MSTLITIDGPAGSGKGTLAERLAKCLGFIFIDSGLTYRTVASRFIEEEGDPVRIASTLSPQDLKRSNLRTEEVSAATPGIAKIPEVRQQVNSSIRRIIESESSGCIIDGRAGGFEFPEAKLKFFLLAQDTTRAKRREIQLRARGERIPFELILDAIRKRDRQDEERDTSPMRPAPGAIQIDTNELDAETVFLVVKLICDRHL